MLADPAAGPAEIDEVHLAQAFAHCDLGQPGRARKLLSTPRATANPYNELLWKKIGAQLVQPGPAHDVARREALAAAAEAARGWSGRSLLIVWRIQARHADDAEAMSAARQGMAFASACGMHGQQLLFQAWLAERLARQGDTAQAVWLAKDSWRLMAEAGTGLTYRGVAWQALVEVLEPHDAALGRSIAHHAADWIFKTAAEHIPPAFRESFLHHNPCNAFLLAKVRC